MSASESGTAGDAGQPNGAAAQANTNTGLSQNNVEPAPEARFYRIYRYRIWNDRGNDDQYDQETDPGRKRKLNIKKLDEGPFQKMVVGVAGAGFFVDGYLLFANNFALPILGYLYWHEDQYSDHETGINCATLAGAIVGQLSLGVLADWTGRKKVYGIELLIIVVASLSISMASEGAIETITPRGPVTLSGSIATPNTAGLGSSSMRITAWLIFWRFIIGFGVGAEYPLTAAITSEWAPCKNRARMLATVFSMQSFGQCVAAIVAYAALRGGEMSLDATWRLLYGVAAIPAAIAMVLRFTIPETPRYLFDVKKNTNKASHAVQAMTRDIVVEVTPRRSRRPGARGTSQDEDILPPDPSFQDFMEYFFYRGGKWYTGNWTSLLGTAGTWFLLDLAFFGLGLNSPQIVTGLYKGCRPQSTVQNTLPDGTWNSEPAISNDPVPLFEDNEYAFWLIVSIGAITGSVALIWFVDHLSRKRLQFGGFIGLAILFFIVGAILLHEIMDHYDGAWFVVVIIYALCQALFNFGPNALTFMFPAEIFPTRYRCSCLGISAAFGKLGSVVAQLALKDIQFNTLSNCQGMSDTNLGKVLLGFGAVMLTGAIATWYLIPEVQHPNKESKTLGVLAKGREQPMGRRPPRAPQQNMGDTEMGIYNQVPSGAASTPHGTDTAQTRSR